MDLRDVDPVALPSAELDRQLRVHDYTSDLERRAEAAVAASMAKGSLRPWNRESAQDLLVHVPTVEGATSKRSRRVRYERRRQAAERRGKGRGTDRTARNAVPEASGVDRVPRRRGAGTVAADATDVRPDVVYDKDELEEQSVSDAPMPHDQLYYALERQPASILLPASRPG